MSQFKQESLHKFKSKIKIIASKTKDQMDKIASEEATKMAIINPILRALNYDTESLDQVDTELSAKIFPSSKIVDKVDYALKKNGDVIVLIEAKKCDNPLEQPEKEFKQLYNYHNKFEKCRFGILTNGIKWICYNEIGKNRLDYNPCFVFNLMNHSDADLEKFFLLSKELFSVENFSFIARKTKMFTLFKTRLLELIDNPTEMRELFKEQYKSCGMHSIRAGSDNEKEIVSCIKKIFNSIITEKIIEKQRDTERKLIEEAEEKNEKSKTYFSKEEKEALLIIRAIACEIIEDPNRISEDDYQNHCNIILDGKKIKKKICTLYLNDVDHMYIELNKKRINIGNNISQLYQFKEQIKAIIKNLIQQ